tara:strand:+ start:5131 stop:5394 length:264 start_codon:yes stop_codon:yes gene_type:complete
VEKPILYVKSGCPWCIDALAYFESKDLDLEIVDVRLEPARMDELVAASGQTKTPTLKHGDFVVADFDLEEFETALAQSPEARIELGL